MNLPNRLTILRILLVPVMVVIAFFNIPGEFLGIPMTFLILNVIFLIASFTDFLDGYLARKNNQVTTFGKFADPLADKILVLTALIILVECQRLPGWIPIVVMTREFIVSGYRLIAVEKGGQVIAAGIWGKLKMVTQIIAIVLAFIDINSFASFIGGELTGFSLGLNITTTVMMTLAVIATIFSGWDYLKGSKELFKDN